MRKWVIIIIIVAFILLPGAGTLVMLLATPPTEVTQGAPVLLLNVIRVAGEGGTIRAGPGTDHEPIGRFAVGDKLNVTGKAVNGPWFRVKLADGRTGYVPIDRMRTP